MTEELRIQRLQALRESHMRHTSAAQKGAHDKLALQGLGPGAAGAVASLDTQISKSKADANSCLIGIRYLESADAQKLTESEMQHRMSFPTLELAELEAQRQQMLDNLEKGYDSIRTSDEKEALKYYHTLVYQLIQRASPETLSEIKDAAMAAYQLQL